MTPVRFTTEDGVHVAGVVREAGEMKHWAMLLHMMPATKESYAALQEALAGRGISSLAIDFRGHGESRQTTDGRILDYQTFGHLEHQAKIKDVEAAVTYLERTYGAATSRLVLVGASIGANLALQYGAAHADVPGMVALSPGLNYRDVATMPLIQSLTRDRHVYLASSADDEISGPAVEKLTERSLAQTDVKQFTDAGHGTRMFETHPEFLEEVADWVAARLEN